jgi:hypothetical protein
MPPVSSPWQPREEEREAILKWIEAGMPDKTGKTHLTKKELNDILKPNDKDGE